MRFHGPLPDKIEINGEPLVLRHTYYKEVILLPDLIGGCWLGVVQAPYAIHEKLVLVGPRRKVDINLKEAGSIDLNW